MVSSDKLQELQRLYGAASGGQMLDPEFRAVAEALFTGDRRPPPYSGICTFLDAPYRPDAAAAGFAGLDVALIGVPMDLGVTNRNGSRFGPRAVRNVERIGPFHHVLRTAPLTTLSVADVGDVPFRSRFDLTQSTEDIETYYQHLVASGVAPLSVGGDHSISYPILRALGAKRPVGMIQIDAHCDTAGPYEGQKFHHGGPFRNAVLDGVLDPERVVQIGIRGGGEYLWEFSYASGMTVIHAEEVQEMGLEAVIAKARAVVGDGPTYLSFDVDGLDPAFTPGTGTPEVGGLSAREANMILNGLKGVDFIGGDVVEVAPQYDPGTNTAQVGAQMLFQILSLMAHAPGLQARHAARLR
ncbi:agmatinase [Phaeovulum sp. W22_SRMD_FR3]|uniref:agmatinase n=1 Tax=Phaeovulum sp. W22_SRMD_FR3 TaxID=3240274 RepID=UPI003F9816E5